MKLGTKLLGSGILNFGLCAARGDPELSPVGRDDQPEHDAFPSCDTSADFHTWYV